MKNFFYLFVLALQSAFCVKGQNETSHWYFGPKTGLDFSQGTVKADTVSGIQNNPNYGTTCASSISDAAGNLIFYTDGENIYNRLHQVINNGGNLTNGVTSNESALIVKKPGSKHEYFVFTAAGIDTNANQVGLRYSVVDMSLSGGLGAVVKRNSVLINNVCFRMTAAKHCNGTDYWLVSQDAGYYNQGVFKFKSFLITSAGINPSPVISSFIYTNTPHYFGEIVISPNGKKIAFDIARYHESYFCVSDFDNATGIISNHLVLYSSSHNAQHQGTEFSPDGTRLYHTYLHESTIWQWNLCAGSKAAVIASRDSIVLPGRPANADMQLGPDGRIYVAKYYCNYLGAITDPNQPASSCNYIDTAVSLGPGFSYFILPEFVSSEFKELPAFTYTNSSQQSCHSASFSAPSPVAGNCGAANDPFTGILWIFGDPSSGAANTSTISAPYHQFSSAGNYLVKLVYYNNSCSPDTLRTLVPVGTKMSLQAAGATCDGLGSATLSASGSGPYSYTWLPSGATTSAVSSLIPGVYTVNLSYLGNACQSSFTLNVAPSKITCHLSTTVECGVGYIEAYTKGGSGLFDYSWNTTHTTSLITFTQPGYYAASVYDKVYGCTVSDNVRLAFPAQPPITPPSTVHVCHGESVTLKVSGSQTYYWSGYRWGMQHGPELTLSSPHSEVFSIWGFAAGHGCPAHTTIHLVVDECSGVTDAENTDKPNFFPNPCRNTLNVTITGSGLLEIADLHGKRICQIPVSEPAGAVDVSDLSPGIYVLTLAQGRDKHVHRLVKAGN